MRVAAILIAGLLAGCSDPFLESNLAAAEKRAKQAEQQLSELSNKLNSGYADRLAEHIEVALYRIAQEGVQNVVKHSRALVASVSFAVRDGVARLEIADSGVGFDTTRGTVPLGAGLELPTSGYGMLSMAERADLVGGTLEVRSQPGAGTTVTVTVPLDE